MSQAPQRLQKVLAQIGIGSRREIERKIIAGEILVNNKPAILGVKINTSDSIKVNNRLIKIQLDHRFEIILYHKKVGEVCTRKDPENRPTVFVNLPRPRHGRWISVGRLDINTSGLMIFTTDGDLANRLMHPSSQIDREYAVRTLGEATPKQLQQLRDGVVVDGEVTKFDDIVDAGGSGVNHWYHVVLKTGKNREVRLAWQEVKLAVSRLIRVRFGPFELAKLPIGKTLRLTTSDRKFLENYLTKCQS